MASNGPKCSICLECYNDEDKCPRMLNCGHSFCSSCLNRLLHGNTIHCPTCRNPVAVPTGVQGLAKNFALLEIINEASREQVVLCPKHKDPFRFFDEDCGIVICRDCHSLYHSGHNCVEVAEAASKYRQEMEALVTKASSQAEKIKAAEALVGRASVSMKEACEEQRAELLGFFGELHAALDSRQQVLMDKLVSLLLQKESILTGQQDRLRLNQVYLESAVQQAKSSIQSSGDVQFLLSRPAMVSTLENKESYSLVLEPEAQFLPEFSEKEQKRESNLGLLFGFRKSKDSVKEAIQSAGDISDISTCTANTIAVGEGTKFFISGQKATFTILSRDSQDRQRNRGGDVYAVELKANKKERYKFKVDVKDQDNGTYLVEYTNYRCASLLCLLPSFDDYTLSVCLRGAHIKGSPFVVKRN